MKLIIKSNGTLTSIQVNHEQYSCDDVIVETNNLSDIEINFTPSVLFSDLELWLEDDDGKLLDHKRINVTKKHKMKMY